MNFYELFYIVVYEAIKINHCIHSYQLSLTKCHVFFCQKWSTFGGHWFRMLHYSSTITSNRYIFIRNVHVLGLLYEMS